MTGGAGGIPEAIQIRLDGTRVPIDRTVFTALFGDSVVSTRSAYLRALESATIGFTEFVRLARASQIPYVLFFAPGDLVAQQLQRKTRTLLAGVSKDAFSMNSRSVVHLRDIELIVRDILRKQEELKKRDKTLVLNPLVDCLRGSHNSVARDADKIRAVLEFTTGQLRANRTKQGAFDFLIDALEAHQVLVAQSQRYFMPQQMPRGVRFSGMCVKDKKIPFIFLTGSDGGDNPEPAGRKVFTLVLLTVFAARGKFAPVTYDDQTGEMITDREYQIAEEVLMPAAEVRVLDASTLDAVREHADRLKVTPSAFVMRAERLRRISKEQAVGYLGQLHAEFAARGKQPRKNPTPINAVRRYAGTEYTRRMFAQMDRGAISPTDFRRIVCLNKLTSTQLPDLRASL